MTLRTASALAALTATLLVAGCGGSDNNENAASGSNTAPAYDYGQAPAKTPEAASSEDAATIKATSGALGSMLVDAEGRTLYLSQGDAEAGQANGQGSNGFGAPWWVVSPQGAAIEKA
jgi:hypothetical protein